jgi:predicted  nucleic acid-binding Zn-ribbon protein
MPTVTDRYTDYLDLVDKTVDQFSTKQQAKKKIIQKYKDTPIEEVPDQALIILYSDAPVDSIPDQVRSRIMNAAVALEAKRRGPVPEEEQSKFAEQVDAPLGNYYGVPGLVPYTKTSKAQRIGIEEGITDSIRTIRGNKKDLREEFRNRVEVAREGAMADYITGIAAGGMYDPVTGVATTATAGGAGMLLKGTPMLATLVGSTGAGATAGSLVPVYPEFGDSRVKNTMFGAALGAGISAVPVGGVKAAQAASKLVKKPAPVVPPKLAPQPVPQTLSGGRVQPKETPVTTATVDIEPQVTQSTPSTLKIQNIDMQIADLQSKASTVGRKKRQPIESQIKKLEQARTNELNRANKKSKEVNEQVVQIENQISRLASRSAELQPGQAGAKARINRAERRIGELETEVDTLTGLDFAPNGGYRVNVNGKLYDNPRQLVSVKDRIDVHNTTGAEIEFILPPPKPTGDPVTDAANKINYIQMSSDAGPRIGLDAPPTLSSAGVRPAIQYADEAAMGVDEAQALKAGTMAESTARKRAEDPRGVDVGRDEPMTAEEKGRRAVLAEATEQRRQFQRAQQMGLDEEDALWTAENLPSIDSFTFENLEDAARILKQEGFIAREYDTLLDMLMDTKRIFTAEEMEALRPLFLEAEQRVDQILRQMRKLKKEGLADSEDMVDLVQDLYLNTYVADLRRTNGTAASHILTQAKKTKRFTAENTRRVDEGKLITNLFGVECG